MEKENIMIIEFKHHDIQMLAMYNRNITTEDKVKLAIQLYGMGNDNDILIMTNKQYRSIFFAEK